MTSVKHPRRLKQLCAVATFSLLFQVPVSIAPAQADALKGGIIGGLGGLVIGGIVGKGGGAAAGAIVGGIGGAIIGSENKKRRQISRPASRRSPGAAQQIAAHSALVSGIQGALLAKGYDPGPVDGRMGPGTANAISAYQQANGLLVTGQASEALLQHMSATGAVTTPQGSTSGSVSTD